MRKLILLLLPLMSASSLFAETLTAEANDMTFTIDTETRRGTLTGANYKMVDAVIPTTVTHDNVEYTITTIGTNAFKDCLDLESVTIPATITKIEKDAFFKSALTKINITDLGAWCNIEFVQQPTKITHRLYLNGEEIRELVIPGTTTNISPYAFAYCDRIASVDIRENVTNISNYAFADCSFMKSIKVPASLKRIGQHAFQGCNNIARFEVSDIAAWCNVDLPYSSFDSNPLSTGPVTNGSTQPEGVNLYINGEKVTDLVIPEGVKAINRYVFQNAHNLTSVTLPQSLESIEMSAFAWCYGLTGGITIPSSVTRIEQGAFTYCKDLTLRISDLKAWCNTQIAEGAWWGEGDYNNPNYPFYTHLSLELDGKPLTHLTVPEDTDISYYAFNHIQGLTSITVPDSFTKILSYMFFASPADEVSLGCNIKSIGKNAFTSMPDIAFCYAMEPPVCDGDQFYVNPHNKVPTLYVPKGTWHAYANAPVWNKFNICDSIEVAGIKDVEQAETSVVEVYNLQGIRLNISSRSELQQLPKGLYIINGRKEIVK